MACHFVTSTRPKPSIRRAARSVLALWFLAACGGGGPGGGPSLPRLVPNDYSSHQGQFDVVRLPEAWQFMSDKWQAEGPRQIGPWPFVVVIDDGFFNPQTQDLRRHPMTSSYGFSASGQLLPDGSQGNFQNHTNSNIRCRGYHGTAVALMIGGISNNAGEPEFTVDPATGPPARWANIASVAGEWRDTASGGLTGGVALVPLRVTGASFQCIGPTSLAPALWFAAGVGSVYDSSRYGGTYPIRVVNISLQLAPGADFSTPPATDVLNAFSNLAGKANVVYAAGNDGSVVQDRGWLAPYDSVVVVGGLDKDGTGLLGAPGFQNSTRTGAAVDIYAPGELYNVQPTFDDPANDTIPDVTTGTSIAAPIVSGVLAMMWNANPCMLPGQHREALLETAQEITISGQPGTFRRLDAYAAVKKAWDEAGPSGRYPCSASRR